MNIGTRSIIFGIHNPVLHGVMVLRAWIIAYNRFPSASEAIAIFFHDIGYFGMRDMDGCDGKKHPEVSTKFLDRLFRNKTVNELVLFHSRSYANTNGRSLSLLALPDKLSLLLYPKWLYIALANMTGELTEYKASMRCTHMTDSEWYEATARLSFCWCLKNSTPVQRHRLQLRFSNYSHTDVGDFSSSAK